LPKRKEWTLRDWKKEAWKWCSRYVRLYYSRNGICTCYTCSVALPIKEMQAGHAFSGRRNSILFELDLIRPQCYGCNCCNSGKLDVFTYRLRNELGKKRFEELWCLRDRQKIYKIPDLQDLIETFKQRVDQLENPDRLWV
jgi:hypothetical protein